ncbi:MAG TPA: DUF3618 domain-containing protein [Longimicrobiaceae bacterium]|nr:DUF3618 domain-containing protein [Longimicrobiaceae bacterium]
MAEIGTDRDDTLVPGSRTHPDVNLRPTAEDHLPAGHALPGNAPATRTPAATTAADPEAVRAEIEQTRERMSETIDEIEEVLARKKERLQERLDVLSPVRERPLAAAGIAFGAGLVLGLLTGGGDDAGESRTLPGTGGMTAGMSLMSHEGTNWEERAHLWESRARRLLRVAREQEERIHELQERYGDLYAHDLEHHGTPDEQAAGALGSAATGLRESVLGGITDFLTDVYRQMGQEKPQQA